MFPKYSLSLAQLQAFLDATEASGYHYEEAWINGLGEPLLWEHLLPGLRLIRASDISDSVIVATNGIALPARGGLIRRFAKIRFGGEKYVPFMLLPDGAEGTTPCRCRCGGPMLFGDRIYPYCGPPVFATGLEPVSVPVASGYMDGAPRSGNDPRELEACRTCWGNMNIKLEPAK